MMSMNSSGYLALARHGLKLACHGLKLPTHGLKLARYGFKLAHHGLNFAQNGLNLACHGLKLPTHGLKFARHGLRNWRGTEWGRGSPKCAPFSDLSRSCPRAVARETAPIDIGGSHFFAFSRVRRHQATAAWIELGMSWIEIANAWIEICTSCIEKLERHRVGTRHPSM